jgi:hypothetical protein
MKIFGTHHLDPVRVRLLVSRSPLRRFLSPLDIAEVAMKVRVSCLVSGRKQENRRAHLGLQDAHGIPFDTMRGDGALITTRN